jgi:hypothetical protein
MWYSCLSCGDDNPKPEYRICGKCIKEASDEINEGLRHAARWVNGEPHDDFCPAQQKKQCDCGKALAKEQILAAIAKASNR